MTTSTLATLTIGGESQPGDAGSYPVHNPARPAEIVGVAPAADRAQLDAAVTAARKASVGGVRSMSPSGSPKSRRRR